jgi:hypothetical protein
MSKSKPTISFSSIIEPWVSNDGCQNANALENGKHSQARS